jgi:MFS family permease
MQRRYGWLVLMVAGAAMVGTLPGRTQGLGLITEPLLADLGIDRIGYAGLNFWATLIGSAGALGIGYAIDRLGTRGVLTGVLLALGLIVILMSRASSYGELALWIALTRLVGQGALSVVSLAIVGHWFVKRLDTAMAVYSIAISVGFMAAFPLVGYAVQGFGWRGAWMGVGVVLGVVLAPAAWAVVRRNPESIGLLPDAGKPTPPQPTTPAGEVLAGYAWTEALAMPSFWVFASGTALYGLVASGIGLFNESVLAERGFSAEVYYQTLAVTALTGLAGNFAGGWLAHKVALGRLMGGSLFILAGGLVAFPFVTTLTHVWMWATAMGLGGGLVMVLFFSVWGRLFGRRHLGRIQGAAQALTVVASAIGPLLLAWTLELTGSYVAIFEILAAVIAATAVAAILVSLPAPPPVLSPVRGLGSDASR